MSVPSRWERSTLGQLGQYLNGRGFKKAEWSTSGRPIIRIQNLTGSSSEFNYFDGEADARHTAHSGDLLVSWAATLGAYFWNGPEAVVNQHIFKVESYIEPKFHKYLLDYKLEELKHETHGSGMAHITRPKFDALPVAIPGRDEQRRIVELVEEHLSHLDAADAALSANLERLDGLESRLAEECVTGGAQLGDRRPAQLDSAGTADGVLPSLPSGWHWERLGNVADVVGGVTKDAKKQSDPTIPEVPYLRVANVKRAALDLSQVTMIRVRETKAQALRLLPGDVLMNEGGDRDKLARGWVWQGEIDDCIHQNHVFRARLRTDLNPYFLSWTANTFGQRWAERNGKQSVNLASISLSMIRKMPVVVAPGAESDAAIEQLHQKLDATSALRKELEKGRARSAALRRAILAAAFSGRLTESPFSI